MIQISVNCIDFPGYLITKYRKKFPLFTLTHYVHFESLGLVAFQINFLSYSILNNGFSISLKDNHLVSSSCLLVNEPLTMFQQLLFSNNALSILCFLCNFNTSERRIYQYIVMLLTVKVLSILFPMEDFTQADAYQYLSEKTCRFHSVCKRLMCWSKENCYTFH